MKRCPECRRDYYDDSLLYCLDDGSALLEVPASGSGDREETPTALLHETAAPIEAPTRYQIHSTSQPDYSNAVAVLPFANLSRGEDSEYFSDGLAEELLNVLSKIKGLRVAARTSAFAFKGKQVSVKQIGSALQVQSVLEGSVRMAGERVRIAVQLVDVGSGYHLWSETYDRTMDDIFAIQDDIAQSVVGELRKKLLGTETDPNARDRVADEVAKATKGRAADPEAYRLMLLGRHLLGRMNEHDTIAAVSYFRQALDIDPQYAVCWAELGRAFHIASNYAWFALDADLGNAEEALQKALELEPDLAEGHAILGRTRWFRDGDFLRAEQSCRRALALAPDNIEVLLSCASVARELGQFESAVDHCRRAIAIDPLNPGAWHASATANFLAGELHTAGFAARRTLELAPQRIFMHACLGLILLRQGHVEEALTEASLEPHGLWRLWSLAIIHHAAGQSAESDLELESLVREFGAFSAFQVAEAHSIRGEPDKAFEWLERAIEQRDGGRFTAKVSPFLKPLHDDPRWLPLLKKIGFPNQSNVTTL